MRGTQEELKQLIAKLEDFSSKAGGSAGARTLAVNGKGERGKPLPLVAPIRLNIASNLPFPFHAANTSRSLAAGFDCRVRLVGGIGLDEWGGLFRSSLENAGVDLSRMREASGPTGRCGTALPLCACLSALCLIASR